MSFYDSIVVGVTCDGTGCNASYELNWNAPDWRIKHEAEEEGWLVDAYTSYCPDCRGKYGHEEEEE